MDQPQAHTHLNEPGEGLLLMLREGGEGGLPGFARMSMLAREFSESSGVPASSIHVSPLLATPIPIYNFPEHQRRWEGVNPQFMWHPLMWLPGRLALPYQFEDGEVEHRDVWLVRLALELMASGVYNPQTGEWIDVLAMHGLDSTSQDTWARVQEWLDGTPDEVLDSIDLSTMIDNPEELHWGLINSLQILPDLEAASWHLFASDLLDTLNETLEMLPSDAGLASMVTSIAVTIRHHIGEAALDVGVSLGDRAEEILAIVQDAPHHAANLLGEALEVVSNAYRTNLDILMEDTPEEN